MQKITKDLVRQHALPGCVLSVFRQDEIETTAIGVSEDGPFPLASVTKPFTAELVWESIEQGVSELDTPLREVLPEFRLADSGATETMTVRDALCHFSGLPPHTWAWVYGDVDRGRFIRERLPFLPESGPHREKHRYSNILYAVLGQCVEQWQGKSWEQVMQERFVQDLGLKSMRLVDEDWMKYAPPPHVKRKTGVTECVPFVGKANHLIAPASEVMASVPDLAVWGQTLLVRDADHPQWIGQHVVSEKRSHPAMGVLEYGLGWRVDTVNGEKRVWHSGQCSGYTSLLSLYPESGRGIAVATNVSGAVDVLHALDMRIHHGIASDWAEVRSVSERSSIEMSAEAGLLPAGIFEHTGYGRLEVREREGGITCQFQSAEESKVTMDSHGVPQLRLHEYDVSFPLMKVSDTEIRVPFESALDPIQFLRLS